MTDRINLSNLESRFSRLQNLDQVEKQFAKRLIGCIGSFLILSKLMSGGTMLVFHFCRASSLFSTLEPLSNYGERLCYHSERITKAWVTSWRVLVVVPFYHTGTSKELLLVLFILSVCGKWRTGMEAISYVARHNISKERVILLPVIFYTGSCWKEASIISGTVV